MSSVMLETDVGSLKYPAGDFGVTVPVSLKGYWEKEEADCIRGLLRPGDYFVDVGAHVGYFSVMACGIVGEEGYVQAFEPNPRIYPLLEFNLQGCTQAESYQLAASDQQGTMEFFPSTVNSGDTRRYAHAEASGTFLSGSVRLDTFCRNAPSLCKIDTQGSDHLVVAGMSNWIDDGTFPPTIVEWWPEGIILGGEEPESILHFYTHVLGLTWDSLGEMTYSDGYCSLLLTQ